MLKFILSALICAGSISCQTEHYSCDPSVDQWVRKNLTTIRTMSRAEWEKLDPAVSRACFAACLPEQKLNFWIQKFDHALTLDWNEAEKEHITKIKDFLIRYPEVFGPDLYEEEELYDLFDRFMYEWTDHAETNLDWNQATIGSLIFSAYKINNKKGDIKIPAMTQNLTISRSMEEYCDCNVSNDFCSIGYCNSSSCIDDTHGCGWVWVQRCNGLCGM